MSPLWQAGYSLAAAPFLLLALNNEMQALRWEPFCSKVWLIESGRPNSIPSSFTQRKVAISSRSNPDAPSIIVGDERFEPWTSASEV